MKPILSLLALTVCASLAVAAVGVGENLLVNGTFATEQSEQPEFWSASPVANVTVFPAGGPEGRLPALVLRGAEGLTGTVSVRQQGLVLVAGETYKLSAWVKTKGFASRHNGLIVHNSGWINDIGLKNLPADSDWTHREQTFTLFPSSDREYGVALFAVAPVGELHCADVRLEAVSEGARQGSTSQAALLAAPRLVPLQPLLNRIPRERPELTLGLFGQLPGALADYDCRVSVDGNPIPPQTLAVGPRLVVKLAGLPLGDHRLTAVVSRRGAAEAVVQGSWPISLVAPPKVDPGGLKQLNNLAAEVLNQPLTADPRPLECRFVNPREGWVFFGLETAAPGAEVAVDGQTVITATTPRLEAFRELAAGEHSLTIKGSAGPGRLVVRAIAEIFDYPPAADSQVRENGSYNWAFMHRHILPAVTTLNGGNLPADALAESKAMGLKWLANFNVAPVDDPADVQRRMEAHPGLTQPQYDGLTSDELFFGRASIDNYTKALWAVNNPQDKLIYTWVVGKPAIAGLHTDFISASVNASRGKGRLLYEAYCHPQDDEATARAYLDNFVTDTMRALKRFYPGVEAGTGIIFGNFNQMPIISLEHNPAVDFKYFLDMQVNLIANHPEFANLATTGYWGTYYGDEELARWSFLLMRHYVVEGRKEMLSERYGFRYLPGFVTNPDFAQGLTGWEVKPAAPESIQTATLPGYGQAVQGRWGGAGAGDKVCVMVRRAGAANQVAQRVRGLEVGKAYVLQFVTANRRDLADPKHTPGRHGLDVVLEGANLLPERGYVHIDRRKEARGRAPEQVGQINLHRVVFRATTAEQSIVFTDQAAAPGDELVLNFVQLKPYLE